MVRPHIGERVTRQDKSMCELNRLLILGKGQLQNPTFTTYSASFNDPYYSIASGNFVEFCGDRIGLTTTYNLKRIDGLKLQLTIPRESLDELSSCPSAELMHIRAYVFPWSKPPRVYISRESSNGRRTVKGS